MSVYAVCGRKLSIMRLGSIAAFLWLLAALRRTKVNPVEGLGLQDAAIRGASHHCGHGLRWHKRPWRAHQ